MTSVLSNTRKTELAKLEEDEMIVAQLLNDSHIFEVRLALIKLQGIIKALKETV